MFLGTTALSEFWDKGQEILFLGSWCLRYDRREDWQDLHYQVMPSPWADRDRFYRAAHHLDECSERMLGPFTDYLNAVHGVSYSQRYWRILVGPWLIHFLHALYDRHVHLTEAFCLHPELQTIQLAPESFRFPRDTAEHMRFVVDDAYNLQLFSQLLKAMGYSFPTRSLESALATPVTRQAIPGKQGTSAKRLAKGLLRFASGTVSRSFWKASTVALCDMYCTPAELIALVRRMRWRALVVGVDDKWLPRSKPSAVFEESREGLKHLPYTDEFERLFVGLLPLSFPSLYLEGFRDANAEAGRLTGKPPKVVVSLVGWNMNEAYKFLAAEASERGSRLVAVQHGGNYGVSRFFTNELHESRIADSYYVWGWGKEGEGCYKNIPSIKLPHLLTVKPDARRDSRADKILYVATSHPRYLHRFQSTPVGGLWEDYFDWQLRFLAALSEPLRARILFRPNPHEQRRYGLGVRKRVSERYAEVQWDYGRPMMERIRQSRLLLVDHCATTILEALVGNLPAVAFWNPQRWETRAEAEPYFQSLRDVGILWDSPEAAAFKVAEVYDQPRTWWDRSAVQEVRKAFVERYALARVNWADDWARALEEEIRLSRVNSL